MAKPAAKTKAATRDAAQPPPPPPPPAPTASTASGGAPTAELLAKIDELAIKPFLDHLLAGGVKTIDDLLQVYIGV